MMNWTFDTYYLAITGDVCPQDTIKRIGGIYGHILQIDEYLRHSEWVAWYTYTQGHPKPTPREWETFRSEAIVAMNICIEIMELAKIGTSSKTPHLWQLD